MENNEEPTIMGNIYVSLKNDRKVGCKSLHFNKTGSFLNLRKIKEI